MHADTALRRVVGLVASLNLAYFGIEFAVSLGSVDEVHAWQQQIPKSELLVVPGNSHHVAASDAELCAKSMLDFIGRKS